MIVSRERIYKALRKASKVLKGLENISEDERFRSELDEMMFCLLVVAEAYNIKEKDDDTV